MLKLCNNRLPKIFDTELTKLKAVHTHETRHHLEAYNHGI